MCIRDEFLFQINLEVTESSVRIDQIDDFRVLSCFYCIVIV